MVFLGVAYVGWVRYNRTTAKSGWRVILGQMGLGEPAMLQLALSVALCARDTTALCRKKPKYSIGLMLATEGNFGTMLKHL